MTPRDLQADASTSDPVFVVCVHDVSPWSFQPVMEILDHLRPLVGRVVSAAVIPEPGGQSWPSDSRSDALAAAVCDRTSEVLLHGLTHVRPRSASLLSRFIGFHDEFADLGDQEAIRRVQRGRTVLRGLLGLEAVGFLPPAWRAGRVSSLLREMGMEYLVQLGQVRHADHRRVCLTTSSWDAGPVVTAGFLMGCLGGVMGLLGNTVPCAAIHPADVKRGFLPSAVRRINRWLASGRRPCVFRDLFGLPDDTMARQSQPDREVVR